VNTCQHECALCSGIFEHLNHCGESYTGVLCMTCDKAGWVMVQCDRCDEWKPSKHGLVCEDCGKVRVVA
jgi:hypothetical protein